jgi:hypothetical protein
VRREIDPVTVFGGAVSGGRSTHLSVQRRRLDSTLLDSTRLDSGYVASS